MTRIRRASWSGERGASLPEVLVGTIVGALVMTAVGSLVFTFNDLRLRADDRSQLAGDLAVVTMRFDRDGMMATPDAPARSQAAPVACSTEIDLGFLEDGGAVRYRTVAGSPDGPLWLQRVSGAGTRTLARNVDSCSWRVAADGTGRSTIRVEIVVVGASGESVSQVLRAAPRRW